MYINNITNQIIYKQKKIRIEFNQFLTLYCWNKQNKTYTYKNMFYLYWSLLIKLHIYNTKNLQIITNKVISKQIKSKFLISNIYVKNTSLSTQIMFSIFFWNFYYNIINSIFKSKTRSISNQNNKITFNTRKFIHPYNRIYVKKYKQLINIEPFNMAKPLLSYLIYTPVFNNNSIISKFKSKKCINIMLYYFFNNFLLKSKNKYHYKSLNINKNSTFIYKINKSVYSLNQFILNTLIT